MATIFVGELMTQKLETIGTLSSAQEASKKMRDNNVSSLVVIDDSNNKPTGIVTERDLVRKVCVNDTSGSNSSSNVLIKNIMSSSPLVTIDARLPVEAAADVMIQNKVRHLLVVENNDINRPLGIVTPTDFVAYLKENLNVNEVNARILESLKRQEEEEENVVEELEQEGKLKKNSQKGGQEYEDEEPRQG
ncbi:MAG TPA: CBS domain-containing protein [Nitrososphaeraceae archaeon]|nr:CBS domain-containing protein [Nitrososphaeraceae archaeon]